MSAIFTRAELVSLALVPLAFPAGVFLHETTHYVLGSLAGGQPTFTDYRWGVVPTMVDFEDPDAMPDIGIRIAGGTVGLYPVMTLYMLLTIPENQLLVSAPVWVLFLSASGVSWLDLLASQDPERWRQYTKGNTIRRTDAK